MELKDFTEKEQADLISLGSISDDRSVIQPNGFVIYRKELNG